MITICCDATINSITSCVVTMADTMVTVMNRIWWIFIQIIYVVYVHRYNIAR